MTPVVDEYCADVVPTKLGDAHRQTRPLLQSPRLALAMSWLEITPPAPMATMSAARAASDLADGFFMGFSFVRCGCRTRHRPAGSCSDRIRPRTQRCAYKPEVFHASPASLPTAGPDLPSRLARRGRSARTCDASCAGQAGRTDRLGAVVPAAAEPFTKPGPCRTSACEQICCGTTPQSERARTSCPSGRRKS